MSAYDPIPDLAQLIDGLETAASAAGLGASNTQLIIALGALLTGPYARLRGGLLLDEPGWDVSTEDSIRAVLHPNPVPQHWVERP
jgi:hypothetical protein